MLSSKSRSAVRALIHLAEFAPHARTTEQIASRANVPSASLAKILQSLKRAGIVDTQRGVGGGISLLADPSRISVMEIIRAIEPDKLRASIQEAESSSECHGQLEKRLDSVRALRAYVLGETSLWDLMFNAGGDPSLPSRDVDKILDIVSQWQLGVPPRVHVVGHKRAGKTALIEQLVAHFRGEGIRVATIKHTCHGHELDVPGKDSHRHRGAGAAAACIMTPELDAMYVPHRPGADEQCRYKTIAAFVPGCELMLVEGGLRGEGFKIEVWRKGGEAPLATNGHPINALVTDDELSRAMEIPVWKWSELAFAAARILEHARSESHAIGTQSDRD